MVLVLEQTGQDLLERPLSVAEAEAVLRRDLVQLAVSELGDPAECVSIGVELLDHQADVNLVCGVAVVVPVGAVVLRGVGLRSVAERAEEFGDAVPAVPCWLVGA